MRSVFIVGPDKRIKLMLTYPMTTGRNFDEILRVLDSMQLTAKHKVATPVNRQQGEDVIIAGSVSDEDAQTMFPAGWKAPKPYLRSPGSRAERPPCGTTLAGGRPTECCDDPAMQAMLSMIEHHGLWLVLANVFALQVGLPVPAYPTLIVVGAFASRSDFAPWQVVGVAVLASVLVDLLWYAAGRRLGRRVLRLVCRLSLSPDSCVRQSEQIFARWGPASLMVAKFVPGFAAVATSMACVVRTPLLRFVLFDAIGALLWSGVAVALGWLFRDAVNELLDAFAQAGRWGLPILLAALLLYIAFKAVQRHRLIRMLRMARIGVDKLNAMLVRDERPLIIDVRTLESQRQGCIPGAVWVDSQAIAQSLQASGVQGGEAVDEVIVYCACPNEASAAMVARQLMRAGFKRVRPLAGGFEAWVERGFAVQVQS